MLFGGWKTSDPIPIKTSSYEDFKEFITFLYLGQCDINMENVMAIVDLAESYHVQLLKDKCDQVLTDIQPTPENVFKLCANLKIYSLQNALDSLFKFLSLNAASCIGNESFLEADKGIVLDIVKMERLVIKEEDLFQAIYKWAEHQYHKQGVENPLWIKQYLSDILPHIRFPIMNTEFLHSYVVNIGNLFESFGELSKILQDADGLRNGTLKQTASIYSHKPRQNWNLEFTDINGFKAVATVNDESLIKTIIKSGNKCRSAHYDQYQDGYHFSNFAKECYWNFFVEKLPLNNDVFDLNSCKLYVVRNSYGLIGLKDFTRDDSNSVYHNIGRTHRPSTFQLQGSVHVQCGVIARLHLQNGTFSFSEGCKIKAS